MLLRTTWLAVVVLLVASSPAVKKGTFPALDKKNPVCTFAVDKIRIKGDPESDAPKFYKKSKACKGPQGYAIQDCQLKQCQCRKFHTHVDASTQVVTTWAECQPTKKDSTECVGADMRYCENLLRGKDPLSKSAAGASKNGRNTTDGESSSKSSHSSAKQSKSLSSSGTNSASSLNTAPSDKNAKNAKDAGSFPVVAVVLASVGVILAIVGGTWLVVSKKKKPNTSALNGGSGGAAKDPQGLEFDDFDDDDHNHKDLYTDAKSTSAAVHTVAVPAPPARRHSSGSISSVSSSDDDDDDDKHDAEHDDTWTAYSKK
ncbi:hypothetical protein H310_02715 [Aphanomyces invadans]|uniref:Uncharacterized protein n=1 Tax=Aphanomyces invadans TaxID=157072 RepID=A0A024UJK3_9STRA|nr:hypothetical protein H310_02715 [Aphanomyces invadans]ETW06459.1 hypothetical protein H310_02715 [Aphanomyces invadans]|eukprot:XP_008864534.1 hypothetical protein H310_02715 [Aphanomyces invadans]